MAYALSGPVSNLTIKLSHTALVSRRAHHFQRAGDVGRGVGVVVRELRANRKGMLDVEEQQVDVHNAQHGLAEVQRGL